MYKKCYAQRLNYNTYKIHLWEDSGYQLLEWKNQVYKECDEYDSTYTGLNGEPLKKVIKWNREDTKLHFHDVTPYQKFLIEKYGIDDTPSTHIKNASLILRLRWEKHLLLNILDQHLRR